MQNFIPTKADMQNFIPTQAHAWRRHYDLELLPVKLQGVQEVGA